MRITAAALPAPSVSVSCGKPGSSERLTSQHIESVDVFCAAAKVHDLCPLLRPSVRAESGALSHETRRMRTITSTCSKQLPRPSSAAELSDPKSKTSDIS